MSVPGTHTDSQTARTPPLLTVPEVAAILRVTDRTVRRWANDGRIRRIRLGGCVRFTPESVHALIDDRDRAGNPVAEKEAEVTGRAPR